MYVAHDPNNVRLKGKFMHKMKLIIIRW